MSGIIYGLYEQIINGIITENLNRIDQELVIKETQPLDSAESSKILAEYLTRILREIFDYIDDGDTIVREPGIMAYLLGIDEKSGKTYEPIKRKPDEFCWGRLGMRCRRLVRKLLSLGCFIIFN
ncbi:hypothetical protein JCM15765_16460 [Paradesulfitobacterium aromaticivorans]